jgi:hypothetical protein
LLYAGTTSIFSFKYSFLNDIVKKLKQTPPFPSYPLPPSGVKGKGIKGVRSLSAGIIYNRKQINGSSETLCNETINSTENVKSISVHVPTHLKPINNDQFGHYLAGLIDGDGHFSSKQQLVIVFNSLDVSLAFYIKKRLGYGSVKRVKNKNAYILVLASIEGLEKVINLINGKIRTENKFNQITNNILNHHKFFEFKKKINFKLNLDNDLKNH